MDFIPFNRPSMTGLELENIERAHARGILSGDGDYSKECAAHLAAITGSHRVLLTHSCTAALEMAAILLDIEPGDEVIMPSYTFVSTANAFALRGGVPVFVDIRPDTLNLDERLIESAITERTKAICVVHYAGVACEMDIITDIASRHGLVVVEDAAQGLLATYKGRALGGIGDLGAFSFHETKNVTCGEGGALTVNRPDFVDRALTVHQKGTDRTQFMEGLVDKYSWQDLGSSFHLGELAAAFLAAQLKEARRLTNERLRIWGQYHERLQALENAGLITRPHVPSSCEHNAHMYYVLLEDGFERSKVIDALKSVGINAVFHYIPLHSSPAGQRLSRSQEVMDVTDRVAKSLLRLPLWVGMTEHMVDRVSETLVQILKTTKSA